MQGYSGLLRTLDEKDCQMIWIAKRKGALGVYWGLIICLMMLTLLIVGCTHEPKDGSRDEPTREDFMRYNRHLVWCDSMCIAHYTDSLGLEPHPTDTYLWLTIHKTGEGKPIEDGERVTFAYVVSTLLGDTIYTSAADGLKTVVVGRGEENIGIDEALRCLRHGANATVILIPEKAFGIRGDGRKIRRRTILRYDIQVE